LPDLQSNEMTFLVTTRDELGHVCQKMGIQGNWERG